MSFDPRSIRKGIQLSPRKILLYGDVKQGKSTLAGASPNCLLVPTEDRVAHINCEKTDVITNYQEMIDIFKYLSEGSPYKTLVVDSLDWMEVLLHAYVCEKKGFKSLTENTDANVNYGKGLKFFAVEAWRDFLFNCDYLRETQKMSIVLVAHSQIEKISPPEVESFDRYAPKLDKNATAVITEWTDIIAFLSREIIVKKENVGFNKTKGKVVPIDNVRTLHMESTNPAWISGNSFGLGTVEVKLEQVSEVMSYILTSNNLTEEKQKTKTKKGE